MRGVISSASLPSDEAWVKMKQIFAPVLMLAALFLGGTRGSADVAPTSLEKLTKVCRRAVVSKVIQILDVEGAKIAEGEVLMTLKGEPTTDHLYFVAQPTSVEDTSHAVIGETLLLFLEPEPAEVDDSSPFRKKLQKLIGNDQLWLIAWSGRGRLPVTRIGQTDYVPVLADAQLAEVRFPRNISTIPLPGSDGRMRLAKLDDVVKFVKRKAGRD